MKITKIENILCEKYFNRNSALTPRFKILVFHAHKSIIFVNIRTMHILFSEYLPYKY